MNYYALFPFIAVIAYIPLLITTAGSRPWQKRHTLFILFLVSAMVWSLIDYFFRSNFFPQHSHLLFKAILIVYAVMAVQFHCFSSSFFGPGQGRWLPFAYVSLAIFIALVALGFVTRDVIAVGDKLYPRYSLGIIFMAGHLLTLAGRNYYVFWKRLKLLDSPALYNQIISLMLGMSVVIVLTVVSLLPWGREFPVSHFGNLINAFILSYATIRHRLLDIRLVLRQGSTLVTLGIIGIVSYWLLLIILHSIFRFELDLTASFVATLAGLLVAVFIYRLRGSLFAVMSRAFQGPSYDHRQKLTSFANTIHNIFSLKEQGGELLALLTKAIGIKQTCLLFHEVSSEDFNTQFAEPKGMENELSNLKLKGDNPVVRYLERERKPLTKENLAILPEFMGLWTQEREEMRSKEIELFMPLISRDRLIAILVLGKKQSGRYSLEDFHLLEDVTSRVAVSIEKEYLREQLREREEELSIINRSSAIITSSLDIQEIYGSFIEELKKVIDVSWASIVLAEESGLCCVALSSKEESAYQVGEELPMEGTGTGWVVTHKKALIEPDLSQEMRFTTGENFLQHGLRTMVYLPLIAKGEAIGSFIVASRQPNAYSPRHIKLLEQLASQIAMPLENTRLYAKAEERARNDELTGLLNRRSLDEMIDNEISRHSRYGGVFSLAILDLDSFKSFNDNYGHLAGDRLLRQVGGIIKDAIRGTDHAFRYGGDEFAILLPQTNIDAAIQVAERAREKIAKKVDSGKIQITASIGLASWPADGVSHTDIIAAADATLYQAKRSGGNQSHYTSGNLLPLDVIESSNDTGDSVDSKILGIVNALAVTVDAKSQYTHHHSKKVTEYALALGKVLNLKPLEMDKLETCALLHDIGKIGISEEILNKPGKLTAEEWKVIKVHPQLGAAIIGRFPHLAPCIAGVLHHHERYDGSGYPRGLKGDSIPLEARILAVADAFAAMTSERSYSPTLSYEDALAELKREAGKQFDPHLVEKFLSIYEKQFAAAVAKKAVEM
jgi:diguanylate cyclase (GGDEF)-like protein/putative nucleotidyltransferase with HDIG domain